MHQLAGHSQFGGSPSPAQKDVDGPCSWWLQSHGNEGRGSRSKQGRIDRSLDETLPESSASSASDPLALLEDLGEDVKVSAHSEIQLLRSLLANNKVDPDGFRERTQVVSALFLTMDRYTEVVECDPEADWGLNPHLCNHIHPLLAGTATIFAVSSVVTSLILSTQIKFVPDEYLGDWMASLKWSAEFPLMLFILSIISWALDLSWRGVVHYGTFGMFFFGGMVAIPGVCIIIFYISWGHMRHHVEVPDQQVPPAFSFPGRVYHFATLRTG
eukprot:s2243_g9.t2